MSINFPHEKYTSRTVQCSLSLGMAVIKKNKYSCLDAGFERNAIQRYAWANVRIKKRPTH